MASMIYSNVVATMAIWMEARGKPFAEKLDFAQRLKKCQNDNKCSVAEAVVLSGGFVDQGLLAQALRIDDANMDVIECIRAWRDARG